jgi:hypothetical protein
MKKLFFYLNLMVITSMFCLAQDSPECDTTCKSTPWTHQMKTFTLPTCSMCTIRVWFWDRWDTCQNKYEVMLEDFGWYHDGCDTCTDCNDCINYIFGLNNLAHWVLNQLVIHNPYTDPNSELQPGHCRDDIEAGYVTCYKYVWNEHSPFAPGGFWQTVSCGNQTCCRLIFRACKLLNGNMVYPPVILDYIMPDDMTCSLDCIPFCEEIEPKISINSGENNEYNNSTITLYPNPTKDNIKIQFNVSNKGEYRLQINDLKGKTILDEKISINSGLEEKEINLKTQQNGTYFYKFIYNGELIKTGKFSILK